MRKTRLGELPQFVVVALVLVVGFGCCSRAVGADPKSALCEDVAPGSVQPLPLLVKDWVIVLCTPKGQALGPLVEDEVIIWLNRRNKRPFLVKAFPFNRPLPETVGSAEIRFSRFAARVLQGKLRQDTLKMWRAAFDDPIGLPSGPVVQLDALSVYNNIVFSLFFYSSGDGPRWLLVCLNRCNTIVAADILSGEELKKAITR